MTSARKSIPPRETKMLTQLYRSLRAALERWAPDAHTTMRELNARYREEVRNHTSDVAPRQRMVHTGLAPAPALHRSGSAPEAAQVAEMKTLADALKKRLALEVRARRPPLLR
jgi:hypothetical protein